MIRVFTAFSGYDSQCMALDRLHQHYPYFTYELVGWAEIDKYAIQAHNAVYPQWAERNYGDISKIDLSQVPDFDLFTYSSPCQDFSQAGKQAGGTEGSGTRSSLLWECRRAILAKRPKYLLMENVAALVSKKFIRLFNAWQLELESYGYRNFAKVLNAKDYGVPQNRERIFMVSILDEQARYEFPDPMPLTIRIKDVLEKEVEERYYLHDSKDKRLAQIVTEQGSKIQHGDMLDTYNQQVLHETSTTILCGIDRRRHHFVAEEPIVLGWVRDEKGNVVKRTPVEVANCVTSGKRDNTQNYVAEPMIGAFRGRNPENPSERGRSNGMYKQRLEINENGTSNTLTGVQKDNVVVEHKKSIIEDYIPTENGAIYKGKEIAEGDGLYLYTTQDFFSGGLPGLSRALKSECCDASVCQNYRIRKLTERECFRLMDMPEEYIDRIQAAGISRSQQYKMAGNSIVVACMYHILRKLFIDTEIKTLTLF